MRKDDHGHIVVETLGAFIPFALIMIGIVMLINVVAMQAKVHYALSQTAEEISILSYLDEKSSSARGNTNVTFKEAFDFLNGLAVFFRVANGVDGQDLQAYLNFSEETLANVVSHIFEKYMWHGHDQPETLGLIGGYDAFDFNESHIGNDDKLVLIVKYNIDYTFMGLIRPAKALPVTQTAATKLWRNGNGEGYKYYKENPKDSGDDIGDAAGGGRGSSIRGRR